MCDKQMDDRLVRIEARLVQLMLYLGANPFGKNDEAGFFDVMEDLLNDYTFPKTQDIPDVREVRDAEASGRVPDWAAF